jgi:adenylylsulfate kinase-like enzyme
MIYWFTGQPSHGKTVLANLLKESLLDHGFHVQDLFRIDGDEMRDLFTNKDYSMGGRVKNIDAAQKIAHYLHNQGKIVIVSLVSPYLDQREEFKETIGEGMVEFYVHTSEPRERDHFAVKGYQAPQENFVDIDTTKDSPEESLAKVLEWIK